MLPDPEKRGLEWQCVCVCLCVCVCVCVCVCTCVEGGGDRKVFESNKRWAYNCSELGKRENLNSWGLVKLKLL